MSAQDIFDQFSAPFLTDDVSWRVGRVNKKDPTKAQALAYIDARNVMDRLDAVVGPGNWQDEYVNAGNGATCCRIGILLPDAGWVWKADGAGQTDVEGDKGQFSDAFKRAAVKWGIGRYLYDLDSPWVAIDEWKRFTPESEKKLNEVHDKAAQRLGWGGKHARTVGNAIRLVDSAVRHFVTQPEDAQHFRQANQGVLATLPVEARRHVLETLDRVGGNMTHAMLQASVEQLGAAE